MLSNLSCEALFESAKTQIEEFDERYSLPFGRRFLYTPKGSLEANNGLVVLGLNPGGVDAGGCADSSTPELEWSSERGNAYLVENWSSAIQGKLVSLFQSIESKTGMASLLENSVTSNLVPFRSPQWDTMPNKEEVLAFSKDLWFQLINEIKPKVILTMGSTCFRAIDSFFDEPFSRTVTVGKQSVIVNMRNDVTTIRIPHLSHWSSHCDQDRLVEAVCWGISKLDSSRTGSLRFNPDFYESFIHLRSDRLVQNSENHIDEDTLLNLGSSRGSRK